MDAGVPCLLFHVEGVPPLSMSLRRGELGSIQLRKTMAARVKYWFSWVTPLLFLVVLRSIQGTVRK